ncbi:carboxypeptidase regulatory-like domain-containing protein [Emticicia sp. CRIBPO]|uniref:carboxypeptidase regulatory-like domain-containing protein n=1 Tax=Emticicia sp. CRIBPO TaxID=2683258 RepID=UPI00197A92A7|nr:carboxypeptidase regulatory-like domain-containing protein [Emticicia sp. CRIBPO]
MIKKLIGLIVLITLINSGLMAQTGKFKAGNRAFEEMSYVEAVRNFEAFISNAEPDGDLHKEALTKLAFSYRKLQDSRNAERIYKELFKKYEGKLDSEQLLYYAQALANNGKYKDSQKYYSKYGEQQKEDLRGRKFTVAYMDNSGFYRDSSLYQVNYVFPINSRQADFSPMYYEGGLVFVSSRDESGAIKRVFMQNQTPFLDLFLFSDTATLNRENRIEMKNQVASLGSSGKTLGSDKESSGQDAGESSEPVIEEFSKSLNSKYHEGPVTFYKDYKKIIFTRNNYNKGKTGKSSSGVNMLKLYTAVKKDKKWTNVSELPFNSDEYSCGHPALTPDNRKLYFVSDMKGGYGGTDIYVSEYKNGNWTLPANLGREVNTEGNEMFPFVDEYGNLYFASDGHPGLGGLDIFYLEFRDGRPFGEAENLGAPINSAKDDFGLITKGDRKSGYFSSNRKRGYADDNIYSFIKGCKELNVYVYDEKTKNPLKDAEVRMVRNGVNHQVYYSDSDGKVSICLETGSDFEFRAFRDGYDANSINYGTFSTSLKSQTNIKMYLNQSKKPLIRGLVVSEVDQQPIAGATVTLENQQDQSTEMVITGIDGKYVFQPEKEGKYLVKAVRESYLPNTEEIGKVKQSSKGVTYEQNLGMIAEGDIFKLENIYYDYGKTEIRADARKELDERLIPLMKKYPQIRIEILSHTDSRSESDFNMKLSQDRADEVVLYLMMKGISEDSLVARGYGESELVNECTDDVKCSEKMHQQNRRTEFKIMTAREVISHNDKK